MKKILVIEDEPEMRRNLTALLRYHDYQPIAAENGADGIEAARREKPDLIVCDVFLPGVNGHVLHQRVRAQRPHVADRFVFVTGGALGRAEADYVKGSGRPTLLKPVDVKALLALLEPEGTHDSSPPNSVRTLGEAGASERPTLAPPEPKP